MDNFRKYLTGLGYHWETLLQISGFGDEQEKVDQAQFATDLIGDILHHFDMFVKANQDSGNRASEILDEMDETDVEDL